LKNRVVITGSGIVSPIGNQIEDFSDSLKSGVNGVKKITLFDTTDYSVHIAAQCSIDLEQHFDKKELNKLDRFSAFSLVASEQAIKQANLLNSNNLDNIGVIVGSGIGGINTFETQHKRLLRHPRKVSPYFIPSMISDIAAGQISIKYGFKGINYGIVSACATGSHAIGDAYRQIKYGDADVIVCGGSEAPISPMSIAGFSNMKALTKNSDIDTACRPFDLNRDGFVMGEGAGIVVLESEKSALERNANILCEIIGYGATADAFHITSPVPDGIGASRAMQIALDENQTNRNDIDYINAHGTSTPFNDKNETEAIKKTFGKHAYNLNVSSTKSLTGHLLGAAGAVEAITCILAINNSFIPPTINYHNPDEDCDLNYTPNKSSNKTINYAMSNTFGFGGHNASLIFKKYL